MHLIIMVKLMFLMIISILFFTTEKLNSLPSLDPSLSCPNLNQIIVTSLGVQKLLESLTVNKASGPDGVPTYLLRELSHELAPILASLFQQSLDQGQLPNDWIKANVVPILKKGKRSLASNYRPLSLTSVTSKILEHIICHHIWKHLKDHNVLSNFQHGFCKQRNCETQLIIIMAIHDLVSAVNSKKQVDALISDFSKAFDGVPHQRLL